MKASIQLGNINVNFDSEPYVIAEIGVNHEGSLDKAKELIKLAKDGGANCAKFQSYKASKLAAKESPSYWDTTKEPTTSQFELFSKLDSFGEKEFLILKKYCDDIGIEFLSTPFDDYSLDYLDKFINFYKIASADITNIPFLRKVAMKKKPIILSTGASNLDEIKTAVSEIKAYGCNEFSLLHCILNYPTVDENANIDMIHSLRKEFPNTIVGYSDHTLPDNNMSSLILSQINGARIIEKHFTDDKTLTGNDHYHAMDFQDLLNFRTISRKIRLLGGKLTEKKAIKSEEISRLNARRSIVTNGNINHGDTLTAENMTYKRPGTGISPSNWDEVEGRKVKKDLPDDHIIMWEDLY